MKLSIIGLTAGFVLGAVSFVQAEDLAFTLYNDTSGDISEFYVSTVGTNDWEANLIPDGYVLPADGEITVNIVDGALVCDYDILAVLDDGREAVTGDLDLCDLGSYTVTE